MDWKGHYWYWFTFGMPAIMSKKKSFAGVNGEEVIGGMTRRPPRHYLLKIESFSLLKNKLTASDDDCLVSSEFTIADYKWILSIYPKGNKKDGGDGYISIYARMVDQNFSPGNFVNVMLRFFIYDKFKHNYHITEVEKCFDATKAEQGVPKLIRLDTFCDSSNGFLVNDGCAFGIEIYVVEDDTPTKFAMVSMMHKPKTPAYTWKICNLSTLGDIASSPVFITEGCSWNLKVYPRGYGTGKGKYVCLQLSVKNTDVKAKKAFVEFEICMKNQHIEENSHRCISKGNWFPFPRSGWRFKKFMELSKLNDPSEGFKVDDVVIVEANIISVFMLKES